jgi:hypothetical protein
MVSSRWVAGLSNGDRGFKQRQQKGIRDIPKHMTTQVSQS